MISLADFDISISDKMESIRASTGNNDHINAKTFISGYIWGRPMGIQIHIEDDMFIVRNSSHGATAWNFPVGAERSKLRIMNELVDIKGLKLLKLTLDDVKFADEHYPNVFVFEQATDDNEYIYDSIEHSEMIGKRFSSLRRVLNKFKREHDVETVFLSNDNLHLAEKIMMDWGKVHNAHSSLDTTGIEIDKFLVDNYEQLGLVGTLTYVDGLPSAVTIGYEIAKDMCDIAEMKFEPDINHLGYVEIEEFMRMFGDKYRFFNFEEDMGIAGLKEHKQRLKPCAMNIFWNAYRREDIDDRDR